MAPFLAFLRWSWLACSPDGPSSSACCAVICSSLMLLFLSLGIVRTCSTKQVVDLTDWRRENQHVVKL